MDLDTEWQRLPFPLHPGIVYVVKIRKGGEFIPLYVGKSEHRNIGRIGDYVSCKFTADRDFIVGTAVRRLAEKGYETVVEYRLSSNPGAEEKRLIDDFKERFLLLNKKLNYDYKTTTEEVERTHIRNFVDEHFH